MNSFSLPLVLEHKIQFSSIENILIYWDHYIFIYWDHFEHVHVPTSSPCLPPLLGPRFFLAPI